MNRLGSPDPDSNVRTETMAKKSPQGFELCRKQRFLEGVRIFEFVLRESCVILWDSRKVVILANIPTRTKWTFSLFTPILILSYSTMMLKASLALG